MKVGGLASLPLTVVSCSSLFASNAPTFFEPLGTEQIIDPIVRSPTAIATIAGVPNESLALVPFEGLEGKIESSNLICDLMGCSPDQLLSVSHENSHLNVNFSHMIEGRLANVLIDAVAGSSYVSWTFFHEN